MAVDAFLKIDGITDKVQGGEIRLESFSWGVSNPGTFPTGGGGGAGKASFQDFSFTALSGEQSPLLFQGAATGKTSKSAVLRVTDRGQLLMITFMDVLISSYKVQDGAVVSQKCFEGDLPAVQRGAPTESVSFNFVKYDFQVGGNSTMGGTGGVIG